MKILSFGGSNSKRSINKQLASYVASLFESAEVKNIDLNDFQMPLFSVDLEEEIGIPEQTNAFLSAIDSCDLIVLSLAENNGSYNVGFKNILDWSSRVKDRKVFAEKPMFLMATSTGARGGEAVLEAGAKRFPFMGAKILDTFSLPTFDSNFDVETGRISNEELNNQLIKKVQSIQVALGDTSKK